MQLGMVGLGRMGANMVRRLMRGGHTCVVYDRSPQAVEAVVKDGATGSASPAELVKRLDRPRTACLIVPAALAGNPALDNCAGRVSDSGEGRWTLAAANDEAVPAHVLTAALHERFASRDEDDFQNRVLSAMRFGFGGHVEKE